MEDFELIQRAVSAREYSYSPYSRYRVGAALLTEDGRVYTGCNIENAAYGPSVCAERTAFWKAVSEGKREFTKIAIAGSPEGPLAQFAFPCGVCRQVMMEFCDPGAFQILIAGPRDEYEKYTLKELLPQGFGPSNLTK